MCTNDYAGGDSEEYFLLWKYFFHAVMTLQFNSCAGVERAVGGFGSGCARRCASFALVPSGRMADHAGRPMYPDQYPVSPGWLPCSSVQSSWCDPVVHCRHCRCQRTHRGKCDLVLLSVSTYITYYIHIHVFLSVFT